MKFSDLSLIESEDELNAIFEKEPELLLFVENLIRVRQFSESFLIQHVSHYHSRVCLNFQKNLTPEFCFKYLYDSKTDTKTDDWICFNDIAWYFREKLSIDELEVIFQKF